MSAHAESHSHHPNYVKVWAILVALLGVSVVGPMTGIRAVMLITAFGVALVKAYLVAQNFMHLNVQRKIIGFMLGMALLLMMVLYCGLAADVQKDYGRNWTKTTGFHYLGAPAHEHSETPGSK